MVAEENQKTKKCIVCGHPLNLHIDEGNGWRCHGTGQDGHQCECWLRKNRTGEKGKDFYDLDSRVEEMKDEIEKIQKRLED